MSSSGHGLGCKEDEHLCIRHRLQRGCGRIIGAADSSGCGLHGMYSCSQSVEFANSCLCLVEGTAWGTNRTSICA